MTTENQVNDALNAQEQNNDASQQEQLVNIANEPATGAGSDFESKEEKQTKDDNLERHEVAKNVNTVDKDNASEPVKIAETRVVEVQREENNILSAKGTTDTVVLGNKLTSVDATQQSEKKIDVLDMPLRELYEKFPKWEREAQAENNHAVAAEFANANAGIGPLVHRLKSLAHHVVAFMSRSEQAEDKKKKNGELHLRDSNNPSA